MSDPLTKNPPVTTPIQGAAEAPVVYFEGIQNISLRNGNLAINCFSHRNDANSGQTVRVATAILTVPIDDLVVIVPELQRILDLARDQGLLNWKPGNPAPAIPSVPFNKLN